MRPGDLRFEVIGAPRTKKNHQRIGRVRGRPIILQARTSDAWQATAVLQLRAAAARMHLVPLAWPAGLAARIYRDRRTGDLGNYLAAVCDALERAGIVADDKWILSFDGSRLLVDAKNPRVEIALTVLSEL